MRPINIASYICLAGMFGYWAHLPTNKLKPNCKQLAVTAALTYAECGYPVRIAYGFREKGWSHVQCQAFIKNKWRYLKVRKSGERLFVYLADRDKGFEVTKYLSVEELVSEVLKNCWMPFGRK